MQLRSRVKVFPRLLWYQILIMLPKVVCFFFFLKHWSCFILHNTLTVNAPSPSGWTCLWRLKEQPVSGDTASHSHPAPVLRGLVQLYNKEEGGGLVSCKHALSLLGSVNTHTDGHTHTHTNVASWLKKAGCGPSGVFMI